MPFNNVGVTIIRYTFFDDDNPNDSTHFFVNFNAGPVGIDDLTKNTKNSFSLAYPNPASNQVSFDYTLSDQTINAYIRVHNLLGTVVKETRLDYFSGKLILDVCDLNEGFYFYSIVVNNEVIDTKRLVISR